MQPAEKFMSWLEGYLDANKNSLTKPQIKEIRKKMTVFQKEQSFKTLSPLNEPAIYPVPNVTEEFYQIHEPINEEFLREVERQKGASTMEELNHAS